MNLAHIRPNLRPCFAGFCLSILLGVPAALEAQFRYSANDDGTLTVVGYDCSSANVTIPDAIDGRIVSGIGDRAFPCTNLASVTISSGVTNIRNLAVYMWEGATFNNHPNLTNFTVDPLNPAYSSLDGVLFNKSGDTLIRYPTGRVSDYVIPDSVTTLSLGAFRFTSLRNVKIGAGVTNIALGYVVGSFWETSLTDIEVDARNSAFSSIDGVLFNKNQDTLLVYPPGRIGRFAVPNTVVNIGEDAFERSAGLTNLVIPQSVTTIGDYQFFGCTGLISIIFGGNAPANGSSRVFPDSPHLTVFYLPGTTGWKSQFWGRPALLWNPHIQSGDASFGIGPHGFGFNITGTVSIPLVIEGLTDFSSSSWMPLQTLTLTNGLASFRDSQSAQSPRRFYRIRPP
jgi:hypothetical protein